MEVIVPYEYLTFIIFGINLAYENKREIKYSTLQEVYNMTLDEVIKNYYDDSIDAKIYFLEDKWEEEPTFKTKPFFEIITSLLNKYPNIFDIKNNNTLRLKKDIKYEDLIVEITKIEQTKAGIQRFYDALFSDNIFALLNIKTMANILNKYLNIEHTIENNYINEKDELPHSLFIRELFLYDVGNIAEEKIDAFRYIALTLEKELTYEELPINYEAWKNCDFYVAPEVDKDGSVIFDIVPQLKSLFQYAIFGKDSLSEAKLLALLEDVSFNKSEEEDYELDDIEEEEISEEEAEVSARSDTYEEEKEDDDEEETTTSVRSYGTYLSPIVEEIFFTTYLYNLNEYLKNNNDSNLIITKNRLLYALDNSKLELYKEENITRVYEENKMVILEESDFDFLMIEAIFFCDEVFKSPLDNNTIKKLLFIKTYYSLTHDEELKEIFNKYKGNPEFPFYTDLVFGNNITLKRNLEGEK